jgi:hypothetical protein
MLPNGQRIERNGFEGITIFTLKMNWDHSRLFVGLFGFGRIDPRNRSVFFGVLPNDSFELLHDFRQQVPFRRRSENEIGQVRDAAMDIALVIAMHMDDAIENRNTGWNGWQSMPCWLRIV